MASLLSICAFALLTASYLWPTEEAVSGSGLHLVALWMLLGTFCAAHRAIRKDSPASSNLTLRWADAGVILIAAGHLISTAVVFQMAGDRRAAVNLTLEWMGLATAWWIFRCLFTDRRSADQGVAIVVAMSVGLSCFGVWQHHVFYKEQSQWYQELRNELDQAIASNDASQFARRAEITHMFQERQIPMLGSARIAWENRLLSSSEPLGTFALTNTLAGILATGLVLLIGQSTSIGSHSNRMSWLRISVLTVQISLIAYCLILTKSRSAWLGTCVGLGILFVRRNQLKSVRHAFRWFVAGILIMATAVGTIAMFGGLDKEVILESPRSLQFRLLYWNGSVKMLRERPLAGAGPGNFRQVYLQHKADESSEEIRDPHNLILDAWSSSGLAGFTGLLMLLGWMCYSLLVETAEVHQSQESKPRKVPHASIVLGGLMGGFFLQAIWAWFNGSDEWLDAPSKWLLLAGIPVVILHGNNSLRPIDGSTCFAAATAMIVNLLAAGGFEMPAVMLTLLLCWAANASRSSDARFPSGLNTFGRLRCVICGGLGLAGFAIVLKLGLLPVSASRYHLDLGNTLLGDLQFPARALDQYQRAAVCDPENVTPRQRIAEVQSYRLTELAESRDPETTRHSRQSELNSDERKLIDEALSSCEDLIRADRRYSFGYRLRADVRWNAGRLTHDQRLQELAIQDLQTVTELYPSSVDAWFRLAVRLEMSRKNIELARDAAERVLQLEAINRQWGHSDRFLTDEQLLTVKSIRGLASHEKQDEVGEIVK